MLTTSGFIWSNWSNPWLDILRRRKLKVWPWRGQVRVTELIIWIAGPHSEVLPSVNRSMGKPEGLGGGPGSGDLGYIKSHFSVAFVRLFRPWKLCWCLWLFWKWNALGQMITSNATHLKREKHYSIFLIICDLIFISFLHLCGDIFILHWCQYLVKVL